MTEFDVYRFPLSGYAATNPPNTPMPTVVFSDDNSSFSRDSHGMLAPKNGHRIWVLDRAANLIEVFDGNHNTHLNTIALTTPLSPDPTPDLGEVSPWGGGKRMFLSLRGPNPLSGDPHVAIGSTPGLAVMESDGQGINGTILTILPITNIDAMGIERADAHGLSVRRF